MGLLLTVWYLMLWKEVIVAYFQVKFNGYTAEYNGKIFIKLADVAVEIGMKCLSRTRKGRYCYIVCGRRNEIGNKLKIQSAI
jgi:hypothetical protein